MNARATSRRSRPRGSRPTGHSPPRAAPRLTLSIQGRANFAGLAAATTLRRWIRMALQRDASLVLRFVGAREGRKLNRDYRGLDHATNVLTFDYMETPVRADIVVCVPVVALEARRRGRPFRDHLAHLVIHGTLHAQGWDHASPQSARKMETVEQRLLARLHIPDPYQ